jgi:hypothetical protein
VRTAIETLSGSASEEKMSIREDVPARKHERSITLTKLAVIAGVLIAVFLLGYIPSLMSAPMLKS